MSGVITSVDVSYNSNDPTVYDPSSGVYTVNFNDITYSFTGSVVIAPYVTDTNNGNPNITFAAFGYNRVLSYATSVRPIFANIVSNPSTSPTSYNATITGNIISHSALTPLASAQYNDASGNSTTIGFKDGDPGVLLIGSIQPNGEYLYTFTIQLYTFFTPGGYVPNSITLFVGNIAGTSLNGIVDPLNP
jgi:hypothetical protein